MTQAFLFRFDGSRDNDRYLEFARARGFVLFAGKELRLGPGWIPDYMRVAVEDEGQSCKLAIVELEADANTARISARKYLRSPHSPWLTPCRLSGASLHPVSRDGGSTSR